MELNKPYQRSYKDSISLMTEPSSTASMDGGETNQLFMCEHCLLVQSIPTKHCKLCERCCSKFDHHCLYICSCVGLRNHRPFINFLVSSIVCTSIYLYSLYAYFVAYANELTVLNSNKLFEDQITFSYVLFSSAFHIWLAILLIVNGFSMLMVVFLFLYQIKFISLGFTSQFPPPIAFIKSHKRMSTFLSACLHRIDNLYTFFFESCETNQELYYRQQNEYRQTANIAKPIPLGYYPKNNFSTENALPNGTNSTNTVNMSPIDPNFQSTRSLMMPGSKTGLKNDQFEIDLD